VDAPARQAPPQRVAPPPDLAGLAFVPHRPRPKVVVGRDLLPAFLLLSLLAMLGVPVGWLWSRLAPPEHVLAYQNGQLLPVQLESYHRFDDLVIFVLIGLAVGLATGAAVWLLRERRGPVVMLAAVLGSAVAAWLGMRLGLSFADGHYAVSGAPQVGAVLPQAPRLESSWVILAQPLATALAYGALAAWNGMDDLGRRLG
jgi:hypothetical protein